ncbi:MAG: hypothetical protein N3G77_07885 [Nitrososphaeria archaeon]|nr:hypothetical protein [Nitrososphaeria archaeon]
MFRLSNLFSEHQQSLKEFYTNLHSEIVYGESSKMKKMVETMNNEKPLGVADYKLDIVSLSLLEEIDGGENFDCLRRISAEDALERLRRSRLASDLERLMARHVELVKALKKEVINKL